MNSLKQATFLVLSLSFFGCATVDKGFLTIEAGDGKESVIEAVGQPDDRQMNGKNEALQYCTTGTSFGVSTFNVVWLYDSNVTGLTSYKVSHATSCKGHFRTVNWEDAPDHVIEIRDR